MELELVFNELSCEKPAPSVELARQHIESFVLTMVEATRRGVKRNIRSTCDLQQLELGPGYHWWDWRHDRLVRRELQQYFRSITTKYPALSDAPTIERELLGCDFFHKGRKAAGLGVAHRLDSLAVSLPSSDAWNCAAILIEIQELCNGDIEQFSDNVRHACYANHVRNDHPDWIKQRLISLVKNGSELWDRSAEFFPKLMFCDAVASQMASLPAIALPSVMRGLFQLNQYAGEWVSGGFNERQVGCMVSPDSQSTMQQYAAERTFRCPDGQPYTFSWHAKVGFWRIYFRWNDTNRQLLIGYVGPHLSTVKFR